MEREKLHEEKRPLHLYHRFLDEAGDTTFYGKGKIPIIGNEGVSTHFLVGMLTLNEPLEGVRNKIIELQKSISTDSYFISVPSIQKKKEKHGYFLHAKDDVPEVRKMMFELITTVDCHFEAVVARKDYGIYEGKHNGNPAEFYADLLSYLIMDNFYDHEKMVLNIAHRSQCTVHKNLEKGLEKAAAIATNKHPAKKINCQIMFDVQQPVSEPVINIADYFLWALQRSFERNENRFVDFLGKRIKAVTRLYEDSLVTYRK